MKQKSPQSIVERKHRYAEVRTEADLKHHVFLDWFNKGNLRLGLENDRIDFAIKHGSNALLWAECKLDSRNVMAMLTQLVLTIGPVIKRGDAPPAFIGCFNRDHFDVVSYHTILPIFSLSDFDWSLKPSDHDNPAFKKAEQQVRELVLKTLTPYYFDYDQKELEKFVSDHFLDLALEPIKIDITKNNFITIYYKWLAQVKPSIAIDWDEFKKIGLTDADFYLADLLSDNNKSIAVKLRIILDSNEYRVGTETSKLTQKRIFEEVGFSDEQEAHHQFWHKYQRPPKREYHDYILNRRDLLVPSDIRERKGSFFTPQIWVEKSQEYLAKALGEDWQDEYTIWDCAAGTGNLLEGLTNPRNIWASTLDEADVDVMKQRIKNGLGLFENQVFQFDFLNDPFDKLPDGLKAIVDNPEKRRKLLIYINPPYAEAGSTATKSGTKINKTGVALTNSKILYSKKIGKASNEIYTQFLARIYNELSGSIIGNFSTIKILTGGNFIKFRQWFKAQLLNLFIVPAYTFDNVQGQFPIGFYIWDTGTKEVFTHIKADVFDDKNKILAGKQLTADDEKDRITQWITIYKDNLSINLGVLASRGPDFQNQNATYIQNQLLTNVGGLKIAITQNNLIPISIYFAVRKVIPATWINHNDQFLSPLDGWQSDTEFQGNCFVYTLFNTNISCNQGTNHWIPFTEQQVGCTSSFDSNFMVQFINGRLKPNETNLFDTTSQPHLNGGLAPFSYEAQVVVDESLKLWQHYHATAEGRADYLVNASLYDIKEFFCGRNDKGRMNTISSDQTYNNAIANLRAALKLLAKAIEPKVSEYGFLVN